MGPVGGYMSKDSKIDMVGMVKSLQNIRRNFTAYADMVQAMAPVVSAAAKYKKEVDKASRGVSQPAKVSTAKRALFDAVDTYFESKGGREHDRT